MNILILGTGGREHAIADNLSQDQRVQKIFVIPGNPGMNSGIIEAIPNIDPTDHDQVIDWALKNEIYLTIVGPEIYLEAGIVDIFEDEGILIYGPNKKASQLESSKDFSKKMMESYNIPTASYKTFFKIQKIKDFIDFWPFKSGLVLKVDKLAAGKGVIVCTNKDQAYDGLDKLITNGLYKEGEALVIEENLIGKEVSYFVCISGNQYKVIGDACDYKRLNDNDQGPNTGGMGSYSPCPWTLPSEKISIDDEIIKPTVNAIKEIGLDFHGTLFIGLIITKSGPKVLEYNVRFGDPETQSLLPRIKEGLLNLFIATAKRKDLPNDLKLSPKSSIHLVKVANGYPGTEGISIEKGKPINVNRDDLKKYNKTYETKLYFAGVCKDQGSSLITNGGRVLGLTVSAKKLQEAASNIYEIEGLATFENEFFRKDIGKFL